MSTDVFYELSGVANGAPLYMSGQGVVDELTGSYDLDLDIQHFPMGWDPATIILICCDRMLGFGSQAASDAMNLHSRCGDDYTILDRSGEGRTTNGRTLFRARASSIGGFENGKIYNRSQIHEATFNLLPEERITEIRAPYTAIIQRMERNVLLMTSTFKFSTNFENDCYGFTNYPILSSATKSLSPGQIAIVNIEEVSFSTKCTKQGSGSISIHLKSSIREVNIF